MNIAWFGSSLVSAYWNGAATYYRGLVRALHERGHRVTFFEPDAYERQVERLLASSDYVEHWTNYWDAILLGRELKGNIVDRAAFRDWLRARFAVNAPWDALVRELVKLHGGEIDVETHQMLLAELARNPATPR